MSVPIVEAFWTRGQQSYNNLWAAEASAQINTAWFFDRGNSLLMKEWMSEMKKEG